MAAGGMVYWKNWIRLRDAKKHTIKAFWWFKGDLISQWIPKFYLCDESNPINPQCGKISANFYISLPTHPTHNFTHKNGENLDTLPGWPKKLHLNRPGAQVNDYKVWGMMYTCIHSTSVINYKDPYYKYHLLLTLWGEVWEMNPPREYAITGFV